MCITTISHLLTSVRACRCMWFFAVMEKQNTNILYIHVHAHTYDVSKDKQPRKRKAKWKRRQNIFLFVFFSFHFVCCWFAFFYIPFSQAFYYLLPWSCANAIRPRMSRIIYGSSEYTVCIFSFGIIFRWPFSFCHAYVVVTYWFFKLRLFWEYNLPSNYISRLQKRAVFLLSTFNFKECCC